MKITKACSHLYILADESQIFPKYFCIKSVEKKLVNIHRISKQQVNSNPSSFCLKYGVTYIVV